MNIVVKFNPKKHILGNLCLRNHDWNHTGQSLRYLTHSGDCVICCRERAKRQRELDPEYCKNYNEQWRKNNPDKKRISDKRYREENSEKVKARKSKYQRENREEANKRNRKYEKTEKGRLSKLINCHRRRARKESNHYVKYSSEQIDKRFEEFDNRCAYCSRRGKLHLDHFIAIAHGGGDCIGNLIPACEKCNFSKGSDDPNEVIPGTRVTRSTDTTAKI